MLFVCSLCVVDMLVFCSCVLVCYLYVGVLFVSFWGCYWYVSVLLKCCSYVVYVLLVCWCFIRVFLVCCWYVGVPTMRCGHSMNESKWPTTRSVLFSPRKLPERVEGCLKCAERILGIFFAQ